MDFVRKRDKEEEQESKSRSRSQSRSLCIYGGDNSRSFYNFFLPVKLSVYIDSRNPGFLK